MPRSVIRLSSSFLLSLAIFGCSKGSSPTESNSNTDSVTLVHKIDFVIDGGRFAHQHFDVDSGLSSFSTMIQLMRKLNGFTYYVSQAGLQTDTTYNGFSLTLHWPGSQSGKYVFGNLFSDSNAYGCSVTFYYDTLKRTATYKSINGSMDVKIFNSISPPGGIDSLFGIFSGQFKDSLGNIFTISHGRFYE